MTPHSLGDVPEWSARRWGRRTALIHAHRRHTFEDLRRSVASLRARLAELGAGPDQRIALHMENRPEYLHAYFAAPATGAALVPVNTFLAPAEVHDTLRDCGARVLITSASSLSKLAPALRGLPDLREVLVCGERGAEPLPVPLQINLTFLDEARPEPGPVMGPPAAKEDDVAVIIYTSGTTGRPKGVMLTHRNLLSNAEACIEAVGVTERDRILVCLPMFHSFTEMVGVLSPVLAGMSIVLCGKLDRAEVRRAIVRHRPTIFPAVPAVFAAMSQVRMGWLARRLNPVRIYVSGGAPLSLDTLRAFETAYRRPLCEGYGLSEAGPVVALNPPNGERKPGSIGLPLPGVEVRIAAPDDPDGRPLPPGQTGELLVRGGAVMKGYFRRPEESARALTGGWLRTGDLARSDPQGYLFIMGRRKEMLICRGMNVYPREIEEVLEEHPRVKEAAVIGVADASRGEVPCAFVVLHDGDAVSEADLKRACLEKLARYKVPRTIRIVAALPRNPAGKVMKETLKERAAAQPSG